MLQYPCRLGSSKELVTDEFRHRFSGLKSGSLSRGERLVVNVRLAPKRVRDVFHEASRLAGAIAPMSTISLAEHVCTVVPLGCSGDVPVAPNTGMARKQS
jgi:hypothetical protein